MRVLGYTRAKHQHRAGQAAVMWFTLGRQQSVRKFCTFPPRHDYLFEPPMNVCGAATPLVTGTTTGVFVSEFRSIVHGRVVRDHSVHSEEPFGEGLDRNHWPLDGPRWTWPVSGCRIAASMENSAGRHNLHLHMPHGTAIRSIGLLSSIGRRAWRAVSQDIY